MPSTAETAAVEPAVEPAVVVSLLQAVGKLDQVVHVSAAADRQRQVHWELLLHQHLWKVHPMN